MNIVLSILQIIGWGILIALALLIFAILIVLFCPVKYFAEGEWLDEKWARIKVHWFFHAVRLKIAYGDDLLYGEMGILWKKKTFSKDFTKLEEETDETESLSEETKTESDLTEETSDASVEKQSMISKIKGMIERIRFLYPKFKKMVTDEKNKEAVIHIKDELIHLVKIILPKKSKVDAVFSTGSPDTTGQFFGVMACFPITYSKGWRLIPDFEADELYFKGSFFAKGRIYGYQLVGIVLRIVFDKKCRRLYNIINQFIKLVKEDTNQEVK